MPFYTYECDFLACTRTADDDGEYSAWSDHDGAMSSLRDADVFYEIDGKWYCEKHWHWCVDQDEDPLPGEHHNDLGVHVSSRAGDS